jgi:glycosyltransferase involved in cell wall biosynthesis
MNSTQQDPQTDLPDPYDPAVYASVLDRLEDEARQEAERQGWDWNAVMGGPFDHATIAQQALTLRLLGLFDAQHYRSAYPDIANSGADPLLHYVEYGDREGRWPNAHFNPSTYRQHFEPGALDAVCALYHYAVFGEDLGIDVPTAFSPRRYFDSNPELRPWVDRPLTHFLHLGKPAGLVLHHRIRLSNEQKVSLPEKHRAQRPKQLHTSRGINVIGPLDKVSGLGVSARGYLEGLRRAGAPLLGTLARQLEFPRQTSLGADQLELPPYVADAPVNLFHMNGDTLPLMLEHGGEALFRGSYNIAVWYWELPTLRPEWQSSMKYFDEFWAPTPYIAETLRRSTSKRVTLLPPYLAYLANMEMGGPVEGPPNFLYCFDANSILERKNPGALIDAFQMAFPRQAATPEVRLTLKITYPDTTNPEVQRVYEAAANDDRIRIIDHLLSDQELHQLIAAAAAYVSPHRSEGLGLTVVEAMGAGVPVISTPFSGLGSLIRDDTALPVRYDRVVLPDDYFPYPRGFVWANPDVASLAQRLREVVDMPQEVRSRTEQARREVTDYFCSARLVEAYRAEIDRLDRLAG